MGASFHQDRPVPHLNKREPVCRADKDGWIYGDERTDADRVVDIIRHEINKSKGTPDAST